MSFELHQGILETIWIALQLFIYYVFIDDFDARQAQRKIFKRYRLMEIGLFLVKNLTIENY